MEECCWRVQRGERTKARRGTGRQHKDTTDERQTILRHSVKHERSQVTLSITQELLRRRSRSHLDLVCFVSSTIVLINSNTNNNMQLTNEFVRNNTAETPQPLAYSLRPPESALGAASISQVGGKGLSLIDCSKAGFPVPPGFVLSVAFFESWLDNIKNTKEWKAFTQNPSKDACDALKAQCVKLKLDARQQQELNGAHL